VSLGWVDAVMLGTLLFSVAVGLMRGLLFEIMSVLGWVVAYFAAHWFSPALAPHLPIGSDGSALNSLAAFVCMFVIALILWGLAARLVRLLIRATPLSLPDRLMGSLFGLFRGVVVLLTVATIVALTPWEKSAAWQQSHAAAWLNDTLAVVRPLLPSQWPGAVAFHISLLRLS
jgi:membrane protein required for colicin V production